MCEGECELTAIVQHNGSSPVRCGNYECEGLLLFQDDVVAVCGACGGFMTLAGAVPEYKVLIFRLGPGAGVRHGVLNSYAILGWRVVRTNVSPDPSSTLMLVYVVMMERLVAAEA